MRLLQSKLSQLNEESIKFNCFEQSGIEENTQKFNFSKEFPESNLISPAKENRFSGKILKMKALSNSQFNFISEEEQSHYSQETLNEGALIE